MIKIINYGLGNINSFFNIYKKLNYHVEIIDNEHSLVSECNENTKLILPGVGSFDYALELLNLSGMRNTLDNLVLEKKIKILGVCIGMQIMANESEEGKSKGLGWIKGKVKKLPLEIPLPHMGWNLIYPKNDNLLLKGIENERFYFLHSYHFSSIDCSRELSDSIYGLKFTSSINLDNIYGVQFHPEKSHNAGIKLLKNFAEL